MSERWREKANIIAVEPADTVSHLGDRRMGDVDLTVDERTFERMREGYMCMNCTEAHEFPFPEYCAVCNFEMRKFQPERMEREFAGQKWIGPTMSNADELERMDEESLRKRFDQKIYIPPKRAS